MSRVRFLAVALAAVAPLAAAASEAPHDNADPAVLANCTDCHLMHRALGSSLASQPGGNVNVCDSCHKNVVNSGHGFPWNTSDQAVPGSIGKSHSWSAPVTNLGCQNPSAAGAGGAQMAQRLESGNMTCSVCHDQHNNQNGRQVGTWQHVSYTLNTQNAPFSPINVTTATSSLTVTSVGAAAVPQGYLVQLVTATSFKVSNNGGDPGGTWLGCTAPTNYTYVAYTGANNCNTGANVSLNDANVKVTFAGTTPAAGHQWKFYVGYPFYRIASSEGEMCVACHANRNMADTNGANGTTVMSHPVGAAFGTTTRAANLILDANGATTQLVTASGTDGIATNNLRVSPTNKVTCLSCHSMHNSDSNSTSVDPR